MNYYEMVNNEGCLAEDAMRAFIATSLESLDLSRKRVLVLVPDQTRTMTLPMVFETICGTLGEVTAALDFMVALGTHPPLNESRLSKLFGHKVIQGKIRGHNIFNHTWGQADTFREIGVIPALEINALTEGYFSEPLSVKINQRIFDYDHILVCGPVSPNVAIGISGGNKYFFPGISGHEIINFTHWLAALLTNVAVNGKRHTPIRAVVDRAAQFIDLPKSCLAFVLDKQGVFGVFFGSPEEAWEGASALSVNKHIIYTGRTYQRALAVMPEMYDELWVGGKGMYKLEPVIADGGEVIIYAPHIDTISLHHGALIQKIGYHVRDYFIKQWDEFKDIPHGILAHSTHVKGLGTYDAAAGEEFPRIQVTLATGIPEETCNSINLGYRNPDTINLSDWEGREEEGILFVKRAGELLYQVKYE